MSLITCRDLGSIGRFGNMCFLYCFAKGYAARMGAEFQCGDWVGRKLFTPAANDAPVTVSLPQTEVENATNKPLGYFFGQTDIDIKQFAQHQVFLDYYTRKQAREWLQFKPEFEAFKPDPNTRYSACHLRRGDYTSDPWLRQRYCEVSEASYDRAIKEFNIPEPIFKVQEGWRASFPELDAQGIGWVPDFLLLRDADHLLRGNSSFSVWASWLGDGQTYSPVVGAMAGLKDCAFVKSNEQCTAAQFANQSNLKLKEA